MSLKSRTWTQQQDISRSLLGKLTQREIKRMMNSNNPSQYSVEEVLHMIDSIDLKDLNAEVEEEIFEKWGEYYENQIMNKLVELGRI